MSRATIKRYLKQRRETGEVAAKEVGALKAELVAQLQAHDDVSLTEHCRLWEQSHGVKVSRSTMNEAIKRLGWTRKKRRWVPLNAGKTSEGSFASR